MKRYLNMSLLLLLLIFLGACGTNTSSTTKVASDGADAEGSEIITLTYATESPAGTFPAIQMEEWKKRLEEKTNGKVKVELVETRKLIK